MARLARVPADDAGFRTSRGKPESEGSGGIPSGIGGTDAVGANPKGKPNGGISGSDGTVAKEEPDGGADPITSRVGDASLAPIREEKPLGGRGSETKPRGESETHPPASEKPPVEGANADPLLFSPASAIARGSGPPRAPARLPGGAAVWGDVETWRGMERAAALDPRLFPENLGRRIRSGGASPDARRRALAATMAAVGLPPRAVAAILAELGPVPPEAPLERRQFEGGRDPRDPAPSVPPRGGIGGIGGIIGGIGGISLGPGPGSDSSASESTRLRVSSSSTRGGSKKRLSLGSSGFSDRRAGKKKVVSSSADRVGRSVSRVWDVTRARDVGALTAAPAACGAGAAIAHDAWIERVRSDVAFAATSRRGAADGAEYSRGAARSAPWWASEDRATHGGHRPADLAAVLADYRAAERRAALEKKIESAVPGSGPGASLRRPRTEPRRGAPKHTPRTPEALDSDEAYLESSFRTGAGGVFRGPSPSRRYPLGLSSGPGSDRDPAPRRASLFGAPVTTVAAERGGFVAAGSSAGAFAVWRAEASSERAPSSSSSRDRSCGVIVRAAKGGWGAPNPADSNPRGFGFASGSGVGSGITALGFVSPDGGGGSTMSPAGSGDPVVRGGGSSNASSSSSGFASPSVGNAASSFLVVGGTRGGGVAGWDAATGACVLASPGSHAGAVTSAFAAGAGVVHHGAADDASDVGGGGFGTNLSPALFLTTSDSPSDPRGVRLWDVRAGAREVAASLTGHRGGVTAVAVGGGGSGGFFGDPLVSSNSPLAVAFTGDGAGAVRAWDWRRAGGGATAAAPRAHVGAVTCVAPVGFRGDACVSGGADGVVRALRLDGGNGGGVRLRGHLGAVTSALVVRGGGGGTRNSGGSGSFEGEDEGDDVLVLPPRTRVLRDASVSEDADASSRVPSSAASSSAATRRRGAHRRGFSISGLRAGARAFDGGGTLRGSSLDFDFEEASSLEALGLTRDNDDGDGPDEGIGTVSEADPKAGTGGGLALVSASADGTTRAWRRVDGSPRAAGAGWACVGAAHAHAAGIVAAGVSSNGRGW